MTLREIQKLKLQRGDTCIVMGEKSFVVKEVHEYFGWMHIVDENDFSYTHKDIVEIQKASHV